MSQVNVTSDEPARCLQVLKQAAEPIVAADIACRLGLGGKRETQRRHVRAIVKRLRGVGSMVVATLNGGYWLTADEKIWTDYLEGRKIDAKRIIGEAHRRKKMVTDNRGQGLLFRPALAGRGKMSGYQTNHGQRQARRHLRELLRIKSTLSDNGRKRLDRMGHYSRWLPDVQAAEIERMWEEYCRDFEVVNHG